MVTIDSRIIWAIINFLVLMYLLKRYLYGPVTEMLDKRSQQIDDDLNSATNNKEEAAKLKEKYEADLQQSREKAQAIIEEAETRGKQRAEAIVEESRKEALRFRERNLQEINQAKEEALNELRNEVVSISLLAAGKFIQGKLDQKQHEKLITQYIDNLDKKKLGELR